MRRRDEMELSVMKNLYSAFVDEQRLQSRHHGSQAELNASSAGLFNVAARPMFLETMNVCRWNLERYYANPIDNRLGNHFLTGSEAAQSRMSARLDFLDSSDPCRGTGSGRNHNESRIAGLSKRARHVKKVCKNRENTLIMFREILSAHLQNDKHAHAKSVTSVSLNDKLRKKAVAAGPGFAPCSTFVTELVTQMNKRIR